MRSPSLLLALTAVLFSTGCASITRGTKEVFVVDSTPQDAEVRLSSGQVARTPASFEVGRRDTLTVFVSKPGYKSRTIGAGVDAGTGAMYEHKPNPLMVQLEPEAAPAKP